MPSSPRSTASEHSPVDQLDVGVALHQHEAAPVAQQGGERRVRDAALDGAVAPVVARRVQVLGHRPAAWDTKSGLQHLFFPQNPQRLCYIYPTLTGLSAFFPPQQPMNKHLPIPSTGESHAPESTSLASYLPPCNI